MRPILRSHWRLLIALGLLTIPVLTLCAAGLWYLYANGLWGYVWWPLALSLALAWWLLWRWQKRDLLLPSPRPAASPTWSDPDRQAWQTVEAWAARAQQVSEERLRDMQFYVDQAQRLAVELARHYRPHAQDPIDSLTVPEILAVIELAASDLWQLVYEYVPGSHVLTVKHWKGLGKAAQWYQRASNVYWAVSAMVAPMQTATRYLAWQAGLGRPWQLLKENLLTWFYTAFVYRVGWYLIELYSGRLREGARAYRQRTSTSEARLPESKADPATPKNGPCLAEQESSDNAQDLSTDRNKGSAELSWPWRKTWRQIGRACSRIVRLVWRKTS